MGEGDKLGKDIANIELAKETYGKAQRHPQEHPPWYSRKQAEEMPVVVGLE